jgi:hypothetical protein
MANEKSVASNNSFESSPLGERGYQPRPQQVSLPDKIQGGYQAPAGTQKPTASTTGSGVKPKK